MELAMALVKKIEGSKTRWLTVWNSKNQFWEIISTRKLEKESGIVALTREVAWTLNLNGKKDFVISKMALLHAFMSAGESWNPFGRCVNLDFYTLEVYRKTVLAELERNQQISWLSSESICAGKTANHQIVDPLFCRWNQKWKLIQPWVQ